MSVSIQSVTGTVTAIGLTFPAMNHASTHTLAT